MGAILDSIEIGDVRLDSGEVLRQAEIAYATYGVLSSDGDNCVVLHTYYTGSDSSYDAYIGPGKSIDTDRYFVVVPNIFGNGRSTSPSNSPLDASAFPRKISVLDNIRCQLFLLAELGVNEVKLAAGWSLGGIQAVHLAALAPDLVKNLLVVCGSARCWPINQVFLDGLATILEMAIAADGTLRSEPQIVERSLKSFARSYLGWAYSPSFFHDELYRELGFESVAQLALQWEDDHLSWDPRDLLTTLQTWRHADVGQVTNPSSFADALQRVKAHTVLMPCDEDRYFIAEEAKIEAGLIPDAELIVLHSPYGHCAGAPGRFQRPHRIINEKIRTLLN